MNRKKNKKADGLYVRLTEPKKLTPRHIRIDIAFPLLKDPVDKLIDQEQFRQFLLKHDAAHDVVMSRLSYSETSGVVGCFVRDDKYHVYSTDERYKAYNEKCFDTAMKAYEEVASRLNLDYSETQVADMIVGKNRLEYAASALEYWDFMSKRYGDSADGKNARKNRDVLLESIRDEIRRRFTNVEISQIKRVQNGLVAANKINTRTQAAGFRVRSVSQHSLPVVMSILEKTLTESEFKTVKGAMPVSLRMKHNE